MKHNTTPRGTWLLASVLLLFWQIMPACASEEVSRKIHTSSTNEQSYCQFLHDGTHWTMIPRDSILHLPDKHLSKVCDRSVGKLLTWPEFLRINRAWIGTEEVSLRQAEGTKPISSRRLRNLSKGDRMIIAVHKGSPIQVGPATERPQSHHPKR